MATRQQVAALMAVACPFCGSAAGEPCGRKVKGGVIRPHTLDGEAHDARWQRANLGGASVLSGKVVERRAPRQTPEQVLVASGAVIERPW